MKKLVLAAALILMCFPLTAYGDGEIDSNNIDEQIYESGVYEAYDSLDEDTKELLEDLGLENIDYDSVFNISFTSFFTSLKDIFLTQFKTPFTCFLTTLAVIILCSLFSGESEGFGKSMSFGTLNTAAALFLCATLLVPLGKCVSAVGSAIKVSADLMLILFPILCVMVATSGKVFSSVAVNALGVGCAQAVSEICSLILMPLFNCLLAVGIVGCVAPDYKLDNIVKQIRKMLTVALGIIASIYFSVLAMKSTLAGSSDTVGLKTAKVLVSDFVPVIGSAISDSISTITSYIGVTKSVVGAFGIIAVGAIFLPVILQCVLWVFSLSMSSSIARVFGLKSIESLLKSTSSVLSVLCVILVFIILLFVVNLGVVLMIKGSGV